METQHGIKITEKHFCFSLRGCSWQPEDWAGSKGWLGSGSAEKRVRDNCRMEVAGTRNKPGEQRDAMCNWLRWRWPLAKLELDNVVDRILQIGQLSTFISQWDLAAPPTERWGSWAPHLEPSWADLSDSLHAQSTIGALQLLKLDPKKASLSCPTHSRGLPPCWEKFQTSPGGCAPCRSHT